MNTLNIQPVDDERIKIHVADNPDGVALEFQGDIDMEDPCTLLDPLFARVHEVMTAQTLRTVTADFRKLTFLNSSGIKAVAKWIMKLGTSGAPYRIRILYNRDITWQSTSLQTLTYLVPGSVFVE